MKTYFVKYKARNARDGAPVNGATAFSTCNENPSETYLEHRARETVESHNLDLQSIRIVSVKELGARSTEL